MPVERNLYVTLRFILLAFREVYYFRYNRKYINYIVFLVCDFSDYFVLI
jgi:hypothetical protein